VAADDREVDKSAHLTVPLDRHHVAGTVKGVRQ
jgi:hypothetical protein